MDAISDDLDRTVAARRGVLATLRKCAKLSRRCGMEIAFYAADAKNKWSVGYETTPATSQHLHNTTSLVYTNRDAEWRSTENSRRARFYRLTRTGRKQLDLETADWTRRVSAVARLLKTEA